MPEDPEKRLQRAMDKLSHVPRPKPKPKPSLPGGKRADWASPGGSADKGGLRIPTATVAAAGAASWGSLEHAPPCRPWDRCDLMRRLATFKAMTWFGKPKVISPVNCARRGWINVEMDVIVCEACGARLLFSTPSSWTMQQVEKAASVFSLKLESGHKLLCPWNDNACDEALSLFPPTPFSDLVEAYSERASALLKLSALPVVSLSAVDYMKKRSPLLESFLSKSSQVRLKIQTGITLVGAAANKDMEGALEIDTSDLFYQAQKLISLCGWQPRVLPYVVDSEQQSIQYKENALMSKSMHIHEQGDLITANPSSNHVEIGTTGHADPNHDYDYGLYDPASIVLDCKFCGACVALWAFKIVECPLRLYHLVTDSSNQNALATSVEGLSTTGESTGAVGLTNYDRSAAKEKPVSLNLTIAGGPPPTKQNFKPRVSLPIFSRHLRAELSLSRKAMPFECSSKDQMNDEYVSRDNELLAHENSDLEPSQEPGLKRKRSGDDEKSGLDGEPNVEGEQTSTSPSNNAFLVNGEFSEPKNTSVSENDTGFGNSNAILENKGKDPEAELEKLSQLDNDTSKSETSCDQTSKNGSDSSKSASSTDDARHSEKNLNSEKCEKSSSVKTLEIIDINNLRSNGLKNLVSPTIRNGNAIHSTGSKFSQQDYRTNDFDVIKHHRPFCPWIAPDDGKTSPGWKLTLAAIHNQEKDPADVASYRGEISFLNEADDPIVSVRKLFMSPTPKRLKSKE